LKKGSIIPGKTYEGDYELPGGRVEEKNLKKALTLETLEIELIREVKEELGIVIVPHPAPPLYLAVYEDPSREICDWAFMMSVPPGRPYWDENSPTKRTTIDVSPEELRKLANEPKGQQLLSGWGKRMCRLSLGALLSSGNYNSEARKCLDEVKPDWRETEYLGDAFRALARLRRQLGLE
jgi:ADP-ribose pyrophosphatase YjhB (NUDIX family)